MRRTLMNRVLHACRHGLLVSLVAVVVSRGATQPSWRLRSSAGPLATSGAAIAFDGNRGTVILFGGRDQLIAYTFDWTWEWDGLAWKRLHPPTSPPARAFASMAYDSSRGRIVLFGGQDAIGHIGDTWEWDGTTWTQQFPSTVPAPRTSHAMVYDAQRQRVVMFGGWGGFTPLPDALGDTWEWDGTDWTLKANGGPAPRSSPSMAYDRQRRQTVLFGGTGPAIFGDTWTWDGSAWSQVTPPVFPSPRGSAAAAYDPVRDRTVLYGGGGPGGLFTETWEWDGSTWAQATSSANPSQRAGHGLVYDAARGVMVLYGGCPCGCNVGCAQETWELGVDGYYRFFGGGCPGTAGVATLSAPSGPPLAGVPFTVTVASLPQSAPVSMLLGLSSTSLGGIPLPLSLGFIGMPACTLYTSGDVAFPLFNVGGQASWSFVPQVASHGASFWTQAVIWDAQANPLGLALSDAAEGRVGV